MKTRNGVFYDLRHSCYRAEVDGLTFVFSSKSHLDKFKKKIKENREIVNYSLSKRFKITINVSQLADIVLYRKIETRGFLILTNEGNSICQNEVNQMMFRGGSITQKK